MSHYFGSILLVEVVVFAFLAMAVAFVSEKLGVLRRIKFGDIQQNKLKVGLLQFGFVSGIALLLFWVGWFPRLRGEFASVFGYPLEFVLEGFLFGSSVLILLFAAEFVGNDGKKTRSGIEVIYNAAKQKI